MAGDGTFKTTTIYLTHVAGGEVDSGVVWIFDITCTSSIFRALEITDHALFTAAEDLDDVGVVRKIDNGVAPNL